MTDLDVGKLVGDYMYRKRHPHVFIPDDLQAIAKEAINLTLIRAIGIAEAQGQSGVAALIRKELIP